MDVPKKITDAAYKLLTDHFGSGRFIVVHQASDTNPATKQAIHLVAAVPEGGFNHKPVEVILDDAGRPVELAARAGLFAPVVAPVSPGVIEAVKVKISPTTNDLKLGECDKLTETISVTIPKSAATEKADVYFLADNTGSMGPVINAVKAGASNVLTALLGSGIDLHFGVGWYRDFPGPAASVFQNVQALTANTAAVQAAINSWSASGGGDGPEAQLFGLDQIAQPPGGSIGWRAGAKHIVVWFGDAPGHDPICKAISGLSYDITEGSATAKLQAEAITVLAISTTTGYPQGLDDNPFATSTGYGICGTPGGLPGQASRITAATGGTDVTGINPSQIVTTIINEVIVLLGVKNVHLQAVGAIAPFVTSITPPAYGPLDPTKDNVLTFQVSFSGEAADCSTRAQVFTGAIDVVVDGSVAAQKPTRITVPPCKYTYGVKFVCGTQGQVEERSCTSVRPGTYATEINILNPKCNPANVIKRVIPVVLAGDPVGREPRIAEPRASDRITIPPGMATMDDCCRISELLKQAGGTMLLNVGFLEIISDQELQVTAVYTATDLKGDSLSIDVVNVPHKLT